jgi:hypothetical protein
VPPQQLDDAIADTARNPTTLTPLNMTVSDPPTQAEVQQIASQLDALLAELQRP